MCSLVSVSVVSKVSLSLACRSWSGLSPAYYGSWGCPGHGPVHLLAASAAEIGFTWDPDALAWFRPRLPLLSNLAGLLQHFKAAIFDAWRNKVAADRCGRAGFRERAFVGHPWVFAAP